MSTGSRRLNHVVRCPGCDTSVNPFVENEVTAHTMDLQCPTCSEKFKAWNMGDGHWRTEEVTAKEKIAKEPREPHSDRT